MAQQKPEQAATATPGPARFEWLLPGLVELAARTGLRPAVTITVGGFLVSGELVDARTYFEALAAQVASVPAGALDDEARQALTELLGRFAARDEGPGGGERSANAEPPHVHLLNARVFHPAGAPVPARGTLPWRVRLDAVEALTLRSLEWNEGALG